MRERVRGWEPPLASVRRRGAFQVERGPHGGLPRLDAHDLLEPLEVLHREVEMDAGLVHYPAQVGGDLRVVLEQVESRHGRRELVAKQVGDLASGQGHAFQAALLQSHFR